MPKQDAVKVHYEGEVRRLAGLAQVITQKAESEARAFTEEESAELEKIIDEAAGAKKRIAEIDDRIRLLEKLGDITDQVGGTPTVTPQDAKTLGDAFVSSEGYKALKERGIKGRWTTGPVEVPAGAFDRMGRKLTDAGLTVSSISDVGGNLPLNPQVVPGIVTGFPENRLVLADLFGQGRATANTIIWLEERNNATTGPLDQRYSDSDAAVTLTSEGLAKPAAAMDFVKRSATLDKIAAFLPISDEMLEDEPQIASYINSRLSLFIRQAEDAYLFDELVAAGIGSATGAQLGGSNNWFDAVAAGIMEVQRPRAGRGCDEPGRLLDDASLQVHRRWELLRRLSVQRSRR
jgi:HK97 family phage major capsid protein